MNCEIERIEKFIILYILCKWKVIEVGEIYRECV